LVTKDKLIKFMAKAADNSRRSFAASKKILHRLWCGACPATTCGGTAVCLCKGNENFEKMYEKVKKYSLQC